VTVHVGLTLSPTADLRAASLPLFEDELVDALEWPVDMGFGGVPDWCEALLGFYGDEDRLVAHGVELSLLTVGQATRRERWLAGVEEAFSQYRFAHLSEHLGIMTAGALIGGTPVPHPFTQSAVAVGVRRLRELRERFDVEVGLENLALALGDHDVDVQPDFLEALLDPVDGFLVLDLHNLLCQAENFGRDPHGLLRAYPLHRVRQIHLAGGTHFTPRAGAPFRRDDHERPVPEACLSLLQDALSRCPDLRWVFVEHADNALRDAAEVEAFRATYARVRAIVEAAGEPTAPRPYRPQHAPEPDDGEAALGETQAWFLEALDDAADVDEAQAALAAHPRWGAWARGFDRRALELAHHLVERWGERHDAPSEDEMRAAVLERVGRVAWRRRPIPTPGPGQVVLRVQSCGLCGTDVLLWRGALGAPLPLVLGHEPVGVVEALGEGVEGLATGDRVGVPWAQAGCGRCARCEAGHWRFCPELITWMRLGGGDADFVLADARGCVPIPASLDPTQVSPLLCAGYTVFSGLERAAIGPGERVAVLGLGGLGHLAVQLAALRGAEVVALTTNPTKAPDASALGAHEVFVGDDPLTALARAGGADVLLVTASAVDVPAAVRALRPEGRLLLAGVGGGPGPALPPSALIEMGARLVGVLPGPRDELAALLSLAAEGRVRPWVERYPLGQLRRVLHRLEDRRVRYRAVLVP